MSRQKEDKDLFPQGVIGEEAMLAYLRHELTEEQNRRFEKLLAEDSFAQEALEGLQEIGDASAAAHAVARINKQVREKSGAREVHTLKIHWVNYAWAAVVLGLLIGIGFLTVNYIEVKNKNLAQNTASVQTGDASSSEKEQTATPPPAETPSTSTTPDQQPEAEQAPSDITDQKEGDFTLKKEEAVKAVPSAQLAKNAPADEAPAVSTKNKAGLSTLAEPQDAGGAETVSANENNSAKKAATEENIKTINATEAGTVLKKSASIDEAMQRFNAGDYKSSASQFDAILKKDPNNAEALYFGGISDYIEGRYSKSEKSFDKLLKSGDRYLDGSKWYKANILLQKNKKNEAQKLLEELANSNSSYRGRAVKKLAEMGF